MTFSEDPGSEERNVTASMADESRCWRCLAVFSCPFDMENHYRNVHSQSVNPLVQAELPVCYICEKSFSQPRALLLHMHQMHSDGMDAPYWCKICHFRSSLYDDILYHFQRVSVILYIRDVIYLASKVISNDL